jgi:hypothetical protein
MPPLVPCVCPTFVSAPGVHLLQTPINLSGLHGRYLQARRGWSTAQGRRCAREHPFPLVAVTRPTRGLLPRRLSRPSKKHHRAHMHGGDVTRRAAVVLPTLLFTDLPLTYAGGPACHRSRSARRA